VPAFASWHEGHRAAVAVLDRRPRVPAHVVVETYSVLTRLPPPHRAPADLVAAFLAERIPHPPLVLPPRGYRGLVELAAAHGLAGGSIHDALVAAIARHAGALLLTRDRRAAAVYERVGAAHQFVF
jgi:predicted nucleic acid-binding protein